MPAEEPIQNLPAPINSDPPDGPTQIAAVNAAVVNRLNMRFASVAARDAALPNPVDGMEAMTGTGPSAVKWIYVGGVWRRLAVPGSVAVIMTDYTSLFTGTESGLTVSGEATVIRPPTGRASCALRFSVQGASLANGSQRVEVGQLRSELAPSGALGFGGYFTNGSVQGAITGGGAVSIRWSSASTGNIVFFSAGYAI